MSQPKEKAKNDTGNVAENAPANAGAIRIDLEEVLAQRLPKFRKFIPGWLIRWACRTIRQDGLNRIAAESAGLRGAEFCRGVLKSLKINFEAENTDLLPPPENRRVLYVSNHPLGGLDGMALIQFIQQRHGGKVFFVVNDLLMAVKPLEDVFLPINKAGKQHREAAEAIQEAFAGNDPIIMFPAGLVSRLQKVDRNEAGPLLNVALSNIAPESGKQQGDGCKKERKVEVIADLKWQKMFVNKAYQSRRDVIPLFFSGHNSLHFYKMARRRQRLGLKFNYEQIYLPGELFNLTGATLRAYFGSPVAWQKLTPGKGAEACAARMRELIYSLAPAPSVGVPPAGSV